MFGLDDALTLPLLLRSAAERFGDHPACVAGEESLSYRDLLARVRETAAGYVARGLEPGSRVVLWAPNSIDWVVAGLAVTYAGGVLVPANSRYTAHEVADLVIRTDAGLAIVADGFLGRTQVADLRATGVSATILDLAALPPAEPGDIDTRADAVSPDDVADILFTSAPPAGPRVR